MPDTSLILLILIIALAIGFGVANGFNDAANAIATVIGTKVLSPRQAIIMAACLELLGAASGIAVAQTIGKGILTQEVITQFNYIPVIAALASIIIWATVATYYGMPVSVSHGFVAGLAAAGIALAGVEAVVWGIMGRIMSAVITAPALGFAGGFALMVAMYWIFHRTAPARIRVITSYLQILSSGFVAYSHGKNDGQMPIGVITMALVIFYQQPNLWDELPYGRLWWVVIISALAISSGVAFGGWRVIRTLGLRVTALQPVHGFTAQLSAASVIELASHLGIPVSTTHCISSSIMGVGSTKRFSAVRWGIAGDIITAWVLTFPICGGLGYFFAWLLVRIF